MSDIYNFMKNLEEYNDEELKYLDKQLEEYKYGHKMYIRILAVKMVKKGYTRKEVGEKLRYSRKTIERAMEKKVSKLEKKKDKANKKEKEKAKEWTLKYASMNQ